MERDRAPRACGRGAWTATAASASPGRRPLPPDAQPRRRTCDRRPQPLGDCRGGRLRHQGGLGGPQAVGEPAGAPADHEDRDRSDDQAHAPGQAARRAAWRVAMRKRAGMGSQPCPGAGRAGWHAGDAPPRSSRGARDGAPDAPRRRHGAARPGVRRRTPATRLRQWETSSPVISLSEAGRRGRARRSSATSVLPWTVSTSPCRSARQGRAPSPRRKNPRRRSANSSDFCSSGNCSSAASTSRASSAASWRVAVSRWSTSSISTSVPRAGLAGRRRCAGCAGWRTARRAARRRGAARTSATTPVRGCPAPGRRPRRGPCSSA